MITKAKFKSFLPFLLVFLANPLYSEQMPSVEDKSEKEDKKPEVNEDALRYVDDSVDGFREEEVYSEAEKKKVCQKYEGAVVGDQLSLYKVQSCILRELDSDSAEFREATRKQGGTVSPDNRTLAILWQASKEKTKTTLGGGQRQKSKQSLAEACAGLNGKIVRYSEMDYDYYLVEKCRVRLIPDDETLRKMMSSLSKLSSQIVKISPERFSSLKQGEPVTSSMDTEFAKLYKQGTSIPEIISVKEACAGLNGKDMTYVERIYRIEGCKKRPYDPERLTMTQRNKFRKFDGELTSTQWISLPDGKAMN